MLEMFFLVFSLAAVSFGGGQFLMVGLEHELVQSGRLAPQTFASALALGQSTPGPLAAFTTAVGGAAAGLSGAVGATLGLLAVSLISVWLMRQIPSRWWERRWVRGGLEAVPAVGLTMAIYLGGKMFLGAGSPGLLGVVITAGVTLGKLWRLPVPALVVGAVAAGALLG